MMWLWILLAFVGGELCGFVCAAICSGSWDKAEEQGRREAELIKAGLIYPREQPILKPNGTQEEKSDRQRGNADGQKGGSI